MSSREIFNDPKHISGRFRGIQDAPGDNFTCTLIERDGKMGKMYTTSDCPFMRIRFPIKMKQIQSICLP